MLNAAYYKNKMDTLKSDVVVRNVVEEPEMLIGWRDVVNGND